MVTAGLKKTKISVSTFKKVYNENEMNQLIDKEFLDFFVSMTKKY